MIFGIEEGSYRPIFNLEQLLLDLHFVECHEKFGVKGIYYCILASHDFSPYKSMANLYEKNAQIQKQILIEDWYNNSDKKWIFKETPLSPEDKIIDKLCTHIQSKYRVAILDEYHNLSQEIVELRELKKSLEKPIKEPDKLLDFFKAHKQADDLIKTKNDRQVEINKMLSSIMQRNRFASLNDFIDEIMQENDDER